MRRVIRCASAVLRVRRPIESRFGAKQLVTIVGAGKGIRTLDLLITSNLEVSGVHTRADACAAPKRAERQTPSYQLSWRAAVSALSTAFSSPAADRTKGA